MKVLFLGDVVGKSGCDFVARHLGSIKKTYGVDACIINGENSAEGNGITPDSARMLFDAGADVITTGNHVLKRKEIFPKLDEQNGIIRPANYHHSAPGNRCVCAGQAALAALCHQSSGTGWNGTLRQSVRKDRSAVTGTSV